MKDVKFETMLMTIAEKTILLLLMYASKCNLLWI